MHKTRVLITMGCCLFAMTLLAGAQAVRKPGLWEMTTTRTVQQTPMPPGMNMLPDAHSPTGPMTTTTMVCLTQAMIDKYGIPIGAGQGCKLINVALKATSVTGEMVCTGRMNGKGTWQSSWTDPNTAKGSTHFVGTMHGPEKRSVRVHHPNHLRLQRLGLRQRSAHAHAAKLARFLHMQMDNRNAPYSRGISVVVYWKPELTSERSSRYRGPISGAGSPTRAGFPAAL